MLFSVLMLVYFYFKNTFRQEPNKNVSLVGVGHKTPTMAG